MKSKQTYEELLAENKRLLSEIKLLKSNSKNKISGKLLETEEKAEESEDKFKAFANQAVEGITVADIDGNYVFVNPAFCKMSGYTMNELLELSVFDMKAKNQPQSSFFDSKEKMEGIPIRVNLQRKDKTEYLTEIVGKIVTIGDQKLVLGTVRDISERVKIETELINAREQAEENEEKFKKLSNLTFEGILIHKQGIALDINLSLANMFNYKREELLGENIIKLLVPDKYHSLIYENILKNYALPYQVEGIRKDGSIIPVEIESKSVHADNDNKFRVVAIRDITERKKAELDLKRSEKRYKSLFKDNDSIMLLIDPDSGKILDANKAACNFYGYSFDQFAQMNINQINTLPKDKIKQELKIFRSKRRKSSIYQHKLANNEIRDVEVFGGRIELLNKTVLYSIIHDITEKKSVELELKESEEKFKTITNSANDAIILMDNVGKVAFWNNAAKKIFGYTEKEVIGKDLHHILTPEKYRDTQNKAFSIFKNTGKGNAMGKTLELEGIRKGGAVFPVELSLSAIKLKGKWNAIGIVKDITIRKKNEEALIESEAKLRESNKTKDKFFSIIAHDLKNPFNTLMGFSELLVNKHKIYTEEKRNLIINTVHKVTKNTYNLLENLLDWSRSQSGLMEFAPEKVQIQTLVKKITVLLQEMANSKNISLKCNTDVTVIAYADINMFETILRNLITNAIKFTEKEGHITISVKRTKEDKLVEISVRDTGVGIEKDMIDKLFRIDESSSTYGTEKEEGTGLGLLLCKEFVEKNGGRIWVESVPGKGSRFKFTLPIYHDE